MNDHPSGCIATQPSCCLLGTHCVPIHAAVPLGAFSGQGRGTLGDYKLLLRFLDRELEGQVFFSLYRFGVQVFANAVPSNEEPVSRKGVQAGYLPVCLDGEKVHAVFAVVPVDIDSIRRLVHYDRFDLLGRVECFRFSRRVVDVALQVFSFRVPGIAVLARFIVAATIICGIFFRKRVDVRRRYRIDETRIGHHEHYKKRKKQGVAAAAAAAAASVFCCSIAPRRHCLVLSCLWLLLYYSSYSETPICRNDAVGYRRARQW
mmetsp:Transcript_26582/g.56972  ORF Transcript_26582/g.56972 Transcript_26582/m.56972 type:complete len:261 (-) Transcript_26582:45-827(-)